ncbi:MAG: oligopeptide/dipeptide ABC transporter ATP-binding protein [Spirochaetales bacterium]
MKDTDIILKTENLCKYFKTPQGMLHAVDGVNFSIQQGQTLGVVGESGCGKSTLGRALLHLTDITSGKIFFEGQDISNVKGRQLKQLRKQMQIIFQDPFSSLDPRMPVSEIIAEPFKIYNICKTRNELNEKVSELMDIVGLAQRLKNVYPHELDGGRRQRIGVARAIALNPKFIVCDEPVSALDVSIQAQVINLLKDLQKEMKLTYIFITHDFSVVKHISDHIIVMYLGNVIESASKKDLFDNPMHPYTKALLSAIPQPVYNAKKERIILKGEITSPIEPKPGCRFAPRCNFATEQCMQQTPQLQEITDGHFVACPLAQNLK